MRPCPTCGLYQPDMIAHRRIGGQLAIGGLGVLAALLFVGLGDTKYTWLGCGVGAVALTLLAQLLLLLWNPNRNPERNRAQAKRLLRSGDMQLLRGQAPDCVAPGRLRWGIGPIHGIALAGMAFATLPFFAAELVRLAFGWPMNSTCVPGVVGPGDEARLHFAEQFWSVKGLWNGEASACALNAPELGPEGAALQATTHREKWAGDIWFDRKEGADRRVTPWVAIRVPDAPGLAGKQLQVRADLLVTYPASQGNTYVNREKALTQTTSLRLADRPGAGQLYRYVWYIGGLVGSGCVGLMTLLLMRATWLFSKKANAMKVVHEGEDEPDENRDPDDDEDDRHDRSRRRRRD
jgi:hypothetical protein